MKPKPLASLNHFTLPDVLILNLLSVLPFGDSKRCSSSRLGKSRILSQPEGVSSYSDVAGRHGGGTFAVIGAMMRCPECQTPYEPNAAACATCGLLLLKL